MSRFMAFVDRYLVPMRPGDGWQVVFLVAVVVLVVLAVVLGGSEVVARMVGN